MVSILSQLNPLNTPPPQPIFLRSILIHPPIYVLVFQTVFLLRAFPQKPVHVSSLSHAWPDINMAYKERSAVVVEDRKKDF
jgi:hypothetical protein